MNSDQHHQRHRHHWHKEPNQRPHKRKRTSSPSKPIVLPHGAQTLSRHDLEAYTPLFASYLDLQKQIQFEDLSKDEVKGRWKSFYHKWNRGDLAAGWYTPSVKAQAEQDWSAHQVSEPLASSNRSKPNDDTKRPPSDGDEEDSEGDIGPKPPPLSFSNLTERDEARREATESARDNIRSARKADRLQQKERAEELAPRAEGGTKERMLEKKRETGDAARAYRDAKSGAGDMAEVNDKDMMGSGGGIEEMKAAKQRQQKIKNEREQRRAEIWEAKKLEREERMKGAREREMKVMEGFRKLAAERFGGDLEETANAKHGDLQAIDKERFDKSVGEKFKK